MSKPIIQLNEESVKSELKELVRTSVEETLNELLNKRSRRVDERGKVRAHRGTAGVLLRTLQPQTDDHIGRGEVEHTETEGRSL
jgi:hypothetical protein